MHSESVHQFREPSMDTMIELPAMRRSAELAPNTADADSRTVEVV